MMPLVHLQTIVSGFMEDNLTLNPMVSMETFGSLTSTIIYGVGSVVLIQLLRLLMR